jgi:hypothetical protein
MDQCPGQVLRGTCKEVGPVSYQERSEPGMFLTLDTELRGGRDHGRGGEVLGQVTLGSVSQLG